MENQLKVVVEFKRASGCVSRKIELTHAKDRVPPQLNGRCDPAAWAEFMTDVEVLAAEHPSMASANASCCLYNCVGFAQILFIGFGCVQGDSGDYNAWSHKVREVMRKHSHAFPGSAMMLKEAQNSYWIQIDLTPQQANAFYQQPVPAIGIPSGKV
jgi:hypothetical protein